jgi:hypothetical protein
MPACEALERKPTCQMDLGDSERGIFRRPDFSHDRLRIMADPSYYPAKGDMGDRLNHDFGIRPTPFWQWAVRYLRSLLCARKCYGSLVAFQSPTCGDLGSLHAVAVQRFADFSSK